MTDRARPRIRVHVDAPLAAGRAVELAGNPAHYLRNVMRRGPGDEIALFNAGSGEFRARIEAVAKARVDCLPLERLRPPGGEPPLVLAFAPVKRGPTELIVEKATELGASAWVPLLTERSVVHPGDVKLEKLRQTVITACKQCGRNDLMPIEQPQTWCSFLATPRGDASLLVAHPLPLL